VKSDVQYVAPDLKANRPCGELRLIFGRGSPSSLWGPIWGPALGGQREVYSFQEHADIAWRRKQSSANQSRRSRFPGNRESYREFGRIRPVLAQRWCDLRPSTGHFWRASLRQRTGNS